MRTLLLGLSLAVLIAHASAVNYRPVVVMHGITQSATGMDHVVSWIQEALPGIYVKNVEIGNGAIDSVFMNMNNQVAEFCEKVNSDPKLKDGFNLIGYSQGTLVTRGYIERCSSGYGVYNYVSWDGPQMGQFGVPFVNIDWIDKMVAEIPYDDWVQNTISFAGYWKDPLNYDEYLSKSIFLADINNERAVKNDTYKTNILSLNSIVMLTSSVDWVIVPVESTWFGYYVNNSDTVTVPLEKEEFYIQDWIGLRAMEEAGRVHKYTTDCAHGNYPNPICKHWFTTYTLPYINNTLDQPRQRVVPRVPTVPFAPRGARPVREVLKK